MGRRRVSTILIATLALPFASCGGEDEGRPPKTRQAPDDVVDPCAADDGLEFQRITGFEPGASNNATCDPFIGPAECFYYNFDSELSPDQCGVPGDKVCLQPDRTPRPESVCFRSTPQGAGPTLGLSPVPDGDRCGESAYAFHYSGRNVAVCAQPDSGRLGWGSSFEIAFNKDPQSGQPTAPLDASAWDGISFWIRAGDGPTQTALLATVRDIYTHAPPAGYGPECSEHLKCDCSTAETAPDADKCDPFGLAVLITDSWQFVKLPFALMQQKGFGVPSPLGEPAADALLGVQIVMSAGDWDVWFDDVAFYRGAQ